MNGLRGAYGEFGGNPPYALAARRHMHQYGTTSEQLGAIAVGAAGVGAMNPRAQLRKPITHRGPPERRASWSTRSTCSIAASCRTAACRGDPADDRARTHLQQPPVHVRVARRPRPATKRHGHELGSAQTGATSGRASMRSPWRA